MKKLLLIALMVCMCVSIVVVDIVSAKVSFGGWDKWDQELPPADHDDWNWALLKTKEPRTMTLKNSRDDGKDVVLWFSDLYFGPKKGSKRASAIFYTQGNGNKKDWNISKADLALVAFPPREKEMIIRAYQNREAGFKFFEEWKIPFENNQIVVSEDTNFREVFKEWIEKQVSGIPIEGIIGLIDFTLPELIVWKKTFFMIIDRQKPSK